MYRYSLRKVLSQRKLIVIPCDETFSICNCLNQRVCSSLSEVNKNVKIKESVKPNWIPFSQAKQGEFYQQKPKLDNPFLSDLPLRRFLNYHVPSEVKNEINKDLENFGSRIVQEIDNLGWECELNLPYLRTQDAWGVRVDELITCSAWQKQRDISAEEGLIAIAYERELNYWSRLHQICKLYLYSPSSGLYSCPVAMTDGAAKTIESLSEKRELFQKAYNYLTCRDPAKFWTSGQWMTERRGGSDVANGTETIAVQDKDEGFFHLYGYKWFTSAADSNMALTLAREHSSETSKEGKKGLTLFYLETRNDDGRLNNMQLIRLKNKLGTRQLPTAEILLDGSIAYKMSETGNGISVISHMLNITRLHNAVSAISSMRRILMLARDYSQKRVAFGQTIANFPLHMQVLSRMEVEIRGSLLLLLKVAILLGKSELGAATVDELLLLRLMSPVLKMYTAKQAVSVVSEGLEVFGGQGYMEDSRLPVIFRDCQVLPIWEGTTSVLSMDVIRSFTKTRYEVLSALHRSVISSIENAKQNPDLKDACLKVEISIEYITGFVEKFPHLLNVAAKDISFSIGRTYIGALLIENVWLTKNSTDLTAARRWCEMQDLCPIQHKFSSYMEIMNNDSDMVMDGYKSSTL